MQGVATETPAQQAAFLEAFPVHRSISAAARALGIPRQRVHDWARGDPSFADAFVQAKETVADDLESELLRRAMSGEGQMPDTLGIFLLKGYRPMFRDSYTVTTKSLTVSVDLNDLPAPERHALLQLALRQDAPPPALPSPTDE